jgi:hypothetical protein
MSNTQRTFEHGIYKEISRDPDVINKRIDQAHMADEVENALAQSVRSCKIEWATKSWIDGKKLHTAMFIGRFGTGELVSFYLAGKRSKIDRMNEILEQYSCAAIE